jgi:hypothetical protein
VQSSQDPAVDDDARAAARAQDEAEDDAVASARAKQFASFAIRTSTPSAAARSAPSARPFRHVVLEFLRIPVAGSIAPGVANPIHEGRRRPDPRSSMRTSLPTCLITCR